MNQPETFAQLLAKATPGPFKAARSHEDFDGPMFDLEEGEAKPFVRIYGGKEAVFSCHDLAIIKDADAELIARLLNFAHAGGYQFLYDLMRYDGARLTADGMEQLEILLQTLNNPSK